MSNCDCLNSKEQKDDQNPDIYKSSGTIRVKIEIKGESENISRIYFSPDSNHTVEDGRTNYAIFVPKRDSQGKDPFMCPLYVCTNGKEVEFKFLSDSGIPGNIADAAARSLKVELEVKSGNVKEIASITIPAK